MSIAFPTSIGVLAVIACASANSHAFAGGTPADAALRIHTSNGGGFFGITVATIGDVNNDGFRDYAISEPGFYAGQVHVYSGATGVLLYRVMGGDGSALDFFGLSVVGIGDVNGDNHDDFAVSAPISDIQELIRGKVWAFSGATGQPMWLIEGEQQAEAFGFALASIGDMNGDDVPDLAIGALAWDDGATLNAGRVVVVSGSSGAMLWQWSDGQEGTQAGRALAAIDDLDGDGRDEIVVGSSQRSRVFVIGSATRGKIDQIVGQPGSEFGVSLARVSDADGDDVDDLIIGAPRHRTGSEMTGSITLCSGASLSVLREARGERSSNFGWSVAASGDVDGDGLDDLLIGAKYHRVDGRSTGRIEIRSSATGLPLRRIDGDSHLRNFGASVASLDDLDGDGVGEILVGREGGTSDPGTGYVFSGAPHAPGEMRTTNFQSGWSVPGRTILADLDGDNAAEMITLDTANDRIAVRMNSGSGQFYPPAYIAVGREPVDAACVDLDGDGDRDLVVALRKDNALAVYTNSHGVLLRSGVIRVNRQPVSVVAADFNSDNRMDLAVAGRRDRNVLLLRQTPVSWTYLHKRFARKQLVALGDEPKRLFFTRLNDDARKDLLVISTRAGRASGMLATASSRFTSPRLTTLGTASNPIADFTVGDMTGDGLADIAWCDGASAQVTLQVGLGNGTFTVGTTLASAGQPVVAVCAADLDQNGAFDLVFAEAGAGFITLLIMPQDGIVSASVPQATVAGVRWLAQSDADGDDDTDIAAISEQGAATVLQNLILDP